MIVNPGKFQAIILDKKKTNHTQETIKIDNKAVKVKSSIKLPGVQIDAELNISIYILPTFFFVYINIYTLNQKNLQSPGIHIYVVIYLGTNKICI